MRRYAINATATPTIIYFINDLCEKVQIANVHGIGVMPVHSLSVVTLYSNGGIIFKPDDITYINSYAAVAIRTSQLKSFIEVTG